MSDLYVDFVEQGVPCWKVPAQRNAWRLPGYLEYSMAHSGHQEDFSKIAWVSFSDSQDTVVMKSGISEYLDVHPVSIYGEPTMLETLF